MEIYYRVTFKSGVKDLVIIDEDEDKPESKLDYIWYESVRTNCPEVISCKKKDILSSEIAALQRLGNKEEAYPVLNPIAAAHKRWAQAEAETKKKWEEYKK
ncbi:hypothetical protein [Phage f2b1]|nr:hypothetical protein [Phage f2b1]